MLDSRELGSVLLIALLRSVTRQIRRDWFPNREILECFEHLSTDGGCRAVVLSGAGKNFTAGRREGRGGGGGGEDCTLYKAQNHLLVPRARFDGFCRVLQFINGR